MGEAPLAFGLVEIFLSNPGPESEICNRITAFFMSTDNPVVVPPHNSNVCLKRTAYVLHDGDSSVRKIIFYLCVLLKGTVARDFTALVFFIISIHLGALIHILIFFQIWFQIRRVIQI